MNFWAAKQQGAGFFLSPKLCSVADVIIFGNLFRPKLNKHEKTITAGSSHITLYG